MRDTNLPEEKPLPLCRVTKTDVAQRQVEVAIRMFFAGDDPICVNTLAAAAHNVLHDYLKKTSSHGSKIMDRKAENPENHERHVKWMRAQANFSKHADRKPNEELDFYEEFTMFILFDCVEMLSRLSIYSIETFSYMLWFARHFEDFETVDKIESDALLDMLKFFTPNNDRATWSKVMSNLRAEIAL